MSKFFMKGHLIFLLPIIFKATTIATLTAAVIPIPQTIFPVWVYTNQNSPLSNAPTMPQPSNLIAVYYHDDDIA